MTIYQRAITEFEIEDEDGQHRLVYAYFGLAIYTAQCMEQSFINMLWLNRIFQNGVHTKDEINEIIDTVENSKMTMGNLINEVKSAYTLNEETINQLKVILEKRNYLAHKYFKEEISKFYTDIGRKEMLVYLANFADETKSIDQSLGVYYEKYHKRLGLTEDKLQEAMEELKRIELERVGKSNT